VLHAGGQFLGPVTHMGSAVFGVPTTMSARVRGAGVAGPLCLARWMLMGVSGRRTSGAAGLLLRARVQSGCWASSLAMPVPVHPARFCCWLRPANRRGILPWHGDRHAGGQCGVPRVQGPLGQLHLCPADDRRCGGGLERLPAGPRNFSAFFPGRYAVEAMQAFDDRASGLLHADLIFLALLLMAVGGLEFRRDRDVPVGGQKRGRRGRARLGMAGMHGGLGGGA